MSIKSNTKLHRKVGMALQGQKVITDKVHMLVTRSEKLSIILFSQCTYVQWSTSGQKLSESWTSFYHIHVNEPLY